MTSSLFLDLRCYQHGLYITNGSLSELDTYTPVLGSSTLVVCSASCH